MRWRRRQRIEKHGGGGLWSGRGGRGCRRRAERCGGHGVEAAGTWRGRWEEAAAAEVGAEAVVAKAVTMRWRGRLGEAAVATTGAEGAAVADAVAGWVVPSVDDGSST